MREFTTHRGRVLPIDRDNVDTDQIIPKQFLKRIERTGFGPFLFHDWRRDRSFPLDRPEYAGASILVGGANFGCGSSREHAPWAIEDAGFRVVVAPSFADIFRNNCAKTGLLAVQLSDPQARQLLSMAEEDPAVEVTVDLAAQLVSAPGFEARFEIDPFVKESLLNGWDDVALTLRHEDAIARFESTAAAG